jgi:hypothetical protein
VKALVSSIAGTNYLSRALEKQQAANHIRARGTPGKPEAPRDLQVQSASRSALLTWKLPIFHDDIAGWRVYQGTESNLVAEIRDKGTRQVTISLNAGTTPPVANFFVCAISTLGRESSKTTGQGSALAETGAPAVPTVPPGYTSEAAGGGNRSLVRFPGESQYIK